MLPIVDNGRAMMFGSPATNIFVIIVAENDYARLAVPPDSSICCKLGKILHIPDICVY